MPSVIELRATPSVASKTAPPAPFATCAATDGGSECVGARTCGAVVSLFSRYFAMKASFGFHCGASGVVNGTTSGSKLMCSGGGVAADDDVDDDVDDEVAGGGGGGAGCGVDPCAWTRVVLEVPCPFACACAAAAGGP